MRLRMIPVFLLLVALGTALALAQSKKPLTNSDIVQMVKAGFTEQTITDAIKANDTAFDTSVQGLIALKNSGVSQTIIDAMLSAEARKRASAAVANSPKTPSPAAKAAPANPNDPRSPHDPGIYWLSKGQTGQPLIRLSSTYYSKSKTGGFFTSRMTYGLSKAKWNAVLNGPAATLRIKERSPEFWFYFKEKPQGFGQSLPFFGQATKPEEFILAKLERKGDKRLMVIGQSSVFSWSSGIPSKEAAPFEVHEVEPGIYKVTPTKTLEPGEYCFVPPGGAMGMGSIGGQVFDFGVDREK
jgi:hypothetical protein